jgi:hypothetical protein
MLMYANQVMESGEITGLFSTDPMEWNMDVMRGYFAWGLRNSDTFNEPISLYRSDKFALNPFYNALRWEFSPSVDTPMDVQIRFTL